MNIVRRKPGHHSPAAIVPNRTYAMIVDVLAGKIMTELSAARPAAARETAIELFSLFNQGIPATGINANYLVIQIMDIYLTGHLDMGNAARGYFDQIRKYGLDLSTIDTAFLRKAALQVAETAEDADIVKAARDFVRYVLTASLA